MSDNLIFPDTLEINNRKNAVGGIEKIELFAALAMAGILANPLTDKGDSLRNSKDANDNAVAMCKTLGIEIG